MQEFERRTSFRCPITQEDEAAILRTDRNDLVVRVCERSAGGFGVMTEQPVKFKKGAILSLATSAGCCEVEVMHVGPEEDGVTRIGLKNLRELKFLRGGPLLSLYTLRRLVTTGSGAFRLVTMLVLCAGFFVWGATLPVDDWFRSASGRLFPSQRGDAGNPQQAEQELAIQYLRLDGLTRQRFVAALDLTPNQQTTIRGILEETTTALGMLYERQADAKNPEEWSGLGMQTVYASWRQIEQVLTDEQRAKWDEMLRQAQADAKPESASS
jgi:hypothetical protein